MAITGTPIRPVTAPVRIRILIQPRSRLSLSPLPPGKENPINGSVPEYTTKQFLTGAAIFEGGLLLAALVLGWLVGTDPLAELTFNRKDVLLGLIATLPMLVFLFVCLIAPTEGLARIRDFLRQTISPLLSQCRLPDLILLATLAGVCEEVFFRGFLYLAIEPLNPFLAVLTTNLLFGLAHAVTPLYTVLAAFLGLYLTSLLSIDSTPNLLVPVIAHAVYDLLAFLLIIRDYRHLMQDQKRLQNDADP